jgi:hypothetical protein
MTMLLRGVEATVGGPGEVLLMATPGSPLVERLSDAARRRSLEEALGRLIGRSVTLRVQAEGSAAAQESGGRLTPEGDRSERLRRLSAEEPVLAEAVQEWDLELLD